MRKDAEGRAVSETSRGWRVVGLHHVAFAHGSDLTCVKELGRFLQVTPEKEQADGFVERMFPVGDAWVQTLQADGDGVVQRFLDKRGPSLHHIAFEVDEIETALADLRERGVRLVDEHPRPGGLGTRIAFVHPSAFAGLLVELVEPRQDLRA
jgi:methylmalonyl-CoA/ethylmalonyl-CoA epimerase